jgi:alpha-amylase/alpha-mannosidase (GH57 family)
MCMKLGWQEEALTDRPDWIPEVITQVNVSKQCIESLEGVWSIDRR